MRRAVGVALSALAVGHLAEALVLRRRRRQMAVLPDGDAGSTDVTVVAARGTPVDDATREAVSAVLDDELDVDVVDLVPGDLPAERRLRLLRRVDPGRLGSDPLQSPGGAHEALAVRAALADRLDGALDEGPDRGDLARLTVRAQRYAPARTSIQVAPTLRAGYYAPTDRWAELAEATRLTWPPGAMATGLLQTQLAHLALLAAGVVVAPAAGLAALAAWSAKPALVLGRPGARASLGRWPSQVADTLATLRAGRRARAAAQGTPETQPKLVARPPDDEVFHPRSDTCAWCGAADLVQRVDVPDLLQHKPGRFRLDECLRCGHVFQNPQLSPAGLDYYYDQFYEGIASAGWERVSTAMAPQFRSRADAVAQVAERTPRAWLDVGTGPGHFCAIARERWPDTCFDGLDIGDTVEEAQRRGWVDHGYRGFFPDLAEKLTGTYDVVSMHHYLEHTPDPRRELEAAATVLTPGGLLMIEVPDPESPWGRRLGRYWLCWFQPQHLHFVSLGNLTEALGQAGFEVVATERGPATMGWDVVGSVMLFLGDHLPNPPAPWNPSPSLRDRAIRWPAAAAGFPILAAAAAADVVKDARARRPGNPKPGNAYRVIAKRTS